MPVQIRSSEILAHVLVVLLVEIHSAEGKTLSLLPVGVHSATTSLAVVNTTTIILVGFAESGTVSILFGLLLNYFVGNWLSILWPLDNFSSHLNSLSNSSSPAWGIFVLFVTVVSLSFPISERLIPFRKKTLAKWLLDPVSHYTNHTHGTLLKGPPADGFIVVCTF